ncbi:hypothetical protein HDU96_001171 [Phlyctochytrium bullatum]|nr:hypothetical protein HDU96_001171 [Phlyctochytrium bullatum]
MTLATLIRPTSRGPLPAALSRHITSPLASLYPTPTTRAHLTTPSTPDSTPSEAPPKWTQVPGGGALVQDGWKRPTRPLVYKRIKAQLLRGEDGAEKLPADGKDALERAREFFRIQEEKGVRIGGVVAGGRKGFLERLKADGGDKISVVEYSFLHTDYTRFVPVFAQIRGLTLDEALMQLRWLRKPIARKAEEALAEAIVVAKDRDGLDLSKTYIADAFAEKNGAVLSQEFKLKFLHGRGRYGATPHVMSTRVELTLQEREQPFLKREGDPLEWIRARLRKRLAEVVAANGEVVTAEGVYEEVRGRRPKKEVWN